MAESLPRNRRVRRRANLARQRGQGRRRRN